MKLKQHGAVSSSKPREYKISSKRSSKINAPEAYRARREPHKLPVDQIPQQPLHILQDELRDMFGMMMRMDKRITELEQQLKDK